ncbi:hypothetical protein SETIT_2G331800v2 [Setaria italica]|uniref:Uncharacterized protein n=1 Tax=Setaria italica TaxID=4555 RepID=A0A368Q5V8_SETIT|nr:hypothetical protein SETIT_2G331800v2 [Setaria italica]RCV13253.1 hypothetical protein SETIT_2G331800v2 [Setaria italica]
MDSNGEVGHEELDFHLEATEDFSSEDDNTPSNRNPSSESRASFQPSLPAVHNYPSPGSGFLSVGHAGGKVVLYKLHHYQNA